MAAETLTFRRLHRCKTRTGLPPPPLTYVVERRRGRDFPPNVLFHYNNNNNTTRRAPQIHTHGGIHCTRSRRCTSTVCTSTRNDVVEPMPYDSCRGN